MTELEQLQKENAELKALILEGKEIFQFIKDALGLEKAAQGGMFTLLISNLILKAQRNPQIFEKLMPYITKLNNTKF